MKESAFPTGPRQRALRSATVFFSVLSALLVYTWAEPHFRLWVFLLVAAAALTVAVAVMRILDYFRRRN